MMMATMFTATMALIGLLAALSTNGRKKKHARPKGERGDSLSRRANLKIETWILNVVAVAMCENVIVKQMLSASELKPWIEVRWSRKKIGKSRRNTIGLLGNENDRLLVYSKAQYCRGINKTRTMESIGLKSKEEEEHNCGRR